MKTPVNILVLTYWSLPDALIQTYTLPYVRIIKKQLPPESRVSLFTLEKDPSVITKAEWKDSMQRSGIEWITEAYHPFGLMALLRWPFMIFKLYRLVRKQKINFIHCWATPAGAIGVVLSILTGATLVIDSYEPHAEAMIENGTWRKNGIAFRLLFFLEEWQTRRASFLIAANAGMKHYAKEKYGIDLVEMLVKPACVDLDQFTIPVSKDEVLANQLGLSGKRVAVYAGKLGGIYLDREVFDFLQVAYNRWGDQFRALLLTNQSDEEINAFCLASGLNRSVVVTRFVPHQEVPRYLGLADFALTPVKPVPTKRYCTPIKDGEYWAMGLPVVIPANISDDSDIIEREGIGAVLKRLDAESYRAALDIMESLLAMPKDQLRKKIRDVAIRYRSYAIAEEVYRLVYNR